VILSLAALFGVMLACRRLI